MSRDSYQSLKRHLQDRQNHAVLTIVQEHLFVDGEYLHYNQERIQEVAHPDAF